MRYVSICSAVLALVLVACSSTPNALDNHGIGDPGSSPPPPSSSIQGKFFVGQISVGEQHTCGRNIVGTLFCWGLGNEGQLGSGIFPESLTPKAVALPSGFNLKQVSAGGHNTCALNTDGDAYCWGKGSNGELGNGLYMTLGVPTKVSMPPGVDFTQISVGIGHACALNTFGIAYCWGGNWTGELGDGTAINTSSVPKLVSMPPGVNFKQISAGFWRTCALGSNNKTYCWGNNYNNNLGVASSADDIKVPTLVYSPVLELTGVSFKQISVLDFVCALGSDNKGYCWGDNDYGQLGNGTIDDFPLPKAVAFPAGVSINSIGVGIKHACALDNKGKAFCWGSGTSGLLGNGQDIETVTFPVAVSMPTGVNFISLSTKGGHTCALGSDTKTYCWGQNNYGHLGNGSNTNSNIPVPTKPY